jgi:hypothetical protein
MSYLKTIRNKMGKMINFKEKKKKKCNLNEYPFSGKEPIYSERIKCYFNCEKCCQEELDYYEQGMWRRVGFTENGLEVFCERHGLPIIYLNLLDPRGTLEILDKILGEVKQGESSKDFSDLKNHNPK